MANRPVIRSKRFPHWREPHHIRRKSTGWTLANTLAYGIQCIPIADKKNSSVFLSGKTVSFVSVRNDDMLMLVYLNTQVQGSPF